MLPRNSVVRKINTLVKRARLVKVRRVMARLIADRLCSAGGGEGPGKRRGGRLSRPAGRTGCWRRTAG
jgi:hypothetical protein